MAQLAEKTKLEKNKDKLVTIEEFYRKTPDSMGYVYSGRLKHSSN
jgi:hypothetical protein